MATVLGSKIGNMPCPEHPSVQLLVRENERGTLSAKCDECDDTHYAKKGTGKYTAWLSKLKRFPGADAPPPKEKAKEEGTARKGVFPDL